MEAAPLLFNFYLFFAGNSCGQMTLAVARFFCCCTRAEDDLGSRARVAVSKGLKNMSFVPHRAEFRLANARRSVIDQ
jgi:hypothetical protein